MNSTVKLSTGVKNLITEVEAQEDQVRSFLLYHPSNNGDWSAHRNDFYSSYLQAVSVNVLKDNGPTHSVGITNERLLDLAQDADFWLVNNTEDSNWPSIKFFKQLQSLPNRKRLSLSKKNAL